MKCRQCGSELEGDVKFCPACGARVEAAVDGAPSTVAESTEASNGAETAGLSGSTETPGTQESSGSSKASAASSATEPMLMESVDSAEGSVSFSTMMDTTKEKSQRHILRPVLIIAIVVALIAGTVVYAAYYFSTANADVPVETVQSDFEKTDYFANGFMQSRYVNDSNYEIVEGTFEITEQHNEPVSSSSNSSSDETQRYVEFKGTMRNDSFETYFEGNVYYKKVDNDDGTGKTWEPVAASEPNLGFVKTYDETTPISGVDEFSDNLYEDLNTHYRGGEITCEPETPIKNEDGEYTTTATQKIEYEFWFGTDSGVNTQTFYFDEEEGWKPKDEVVLEKNNTKYALSGKTFELTSDPIEIGDGTMTSALTFVDTGDEDTISADYTIHYVPAATDGDTNMTVQEFYERTLNGRANGIPVHEFGKEDLSFQLVDDGATESGDGADIVSFDCRLNPSSLTSTTGGAGTERTFTVGVYTNEVYCHQTSIAGIVCNYDWRINSGENWFASSCTYTEVGTSTD